MKKTAEKGIPCWVDKTNVASENDKLNYSAQYQRIRLPLK